MEVSEQYHYEQYAEEQYERTANGFAEETFIEWKNRKEAAKKIFDNLALKQTIGV